MIAHPAPAPPAYWRKLLRYDLRGFGRSNEPRPGEPYTHADDLRALLDRLGIAQAAVLGFSLGGWVALEFTLTYPDSVGQLILLDPALREYAYSPAMSASIGELYRLGGAGRHDEAMANWLAHPIFAVTRENAVNAARLAEIVGGYAGCHLRFDDPHPPMIPPAKNRLAEIAVPTLVIVGERDLPDFHRIADLLASEIPQARKTVIPGAGHMVSFDAPAALADAIVGFLG